MSVASQRAARTISVAATLLATVLCSACDATDPDARAVSVEITTSRDIVLGGDTIRFTAEARDAGGSTVVGALLDWSVNNPSLASFVDAQRGILVAREARGATWVTVRLPNGTADSSSLLVQPRPVEVQTLSGNDQRGVMHRELAQPLVAVALASDGLGVAGVIVQFATPSVDAELRPALVATDTMGHAAARWVLGEDSIQVVRAVTLLAESLSTDFVATSVAPGVWTWMAGDSTMSVPPAYGTRGVPDPANTPGSRVGASHAVGQDGSVWLAGGRTAADGFPLRNDLWRLAGEVWTWVAGSDHADPVPVFGTKGVPSASNVPPGREYSALWVDYAGHAWVFGGSAWDDLWRFDGTSWTWMAGDSTPGRTPVYGSRGVTSAGNTPGTRMPGAQWLDPLGRRWMFGAGTAFEGRSDLWRHDESGWVWIAGDSTVGQWPRHGQLGVPDAQNTPGVRFGTGSWTTGSFLWFLGGGGLNANAAATFALGDVWRFDGSGWAWVAGSNAGSNPGVYRRRGLFDALSLIGARTGPAVHETNGIVWIFGGSGIDSIGQAGSLNDLWQFNGVQWSWHSGAQRLPANAARAPGRWGTRGVPHPANIPGGRSRSVIWTAPGGALWMYGGFRHVDLWRYDLTTTP
ncbi:MAG: hypothetical protein WD934_07650 [Gemmatimonadales bacterium]